MRVVLVVMMAFVLPKRMCTTAAPAPARNTTQSEGFMRWFERSPGGVDEVFDFPFCEKLPLFLFTSSHTILHAGHMRFFCSFTLFMYFSHHQRRAARLHGRVRVSTLSFHDHIFFWACNGQRVITETFSPTDNPVNR